MADLPDPGQLVVDQRLPVADRPLPADPVFRAGPHPGQGLVDREGGGPILLVGPDPHGDQRPVAGPAPGVGRLDGTKPRSRVETSLLSGSSLTGGALPSGPPSGRSQWAHRLLRG